MRELYKRAAPHIDRVRLDGGVPTDNVQELLLLKRSNEELKDVLRLSYCPELHGNKIRTSGINNFIAKGYDEATSNDLTQTSSASQPFLDKIAPTEKLSAKKPNGGVSYLTHATINFTSGNKWTLEFALNSNGKSVDRQYISDIVGLSLSVTDRRVFAYIGGQFLSFETYDRYTGKSVVIHLTYDGANYVRCFINSVAVGTRPCTSSMSSSVLAANEASGVVAFAGNIFSYHVFSDALNAQQIAERSSVLRSIFPEIPFTRIGDQIWSVRNYEAICTPQGTLIPEVQLANNTERMTNTGIDGSTDWIDSNGDGLADGFIKSGSSLTSIVTGNGFIGRAQRIEASSGGQLLFINPMSSVGVIAGKTYRVRIRYRASTGFNVSLPNVAVVKTLPMNVGDAIYTSFYHTTTTVNPSYQFYNLSIGLAATGDFFEIDEWSVQEVGWADSQNLYDYTYAATAGTVEQKTYAACKAAAMWCHYNNDATLGTTYGKLYNWFAVKLLQMDIDYFNAANPTTPWGWRVPTQADFNTLATTLGGTAVAGGKMKLNDSRYWSSPNVGADNSSGFSAIGSGFRNEAGSAFNSLAILGTYITVENDAPSDTLINWVSVDSNTISAANRRSKIRGVSLRLIKTA